MKSFIAFLFVAVAVVAVAHGHPGGLTGIPWGVNIVGPAIAPPSVVSVVNPAVTIAKPGLLAPGWAGPITPLGLGTGKLVGGGIWG